MQMMPGIMRGFKLSFPFPLLIYFGRDWSYFAVVYAIAVRCFKDLCLNRIKLYVSLFLVLFNNMEQ